MPAESSTRRPGAPMVHRLVKWGTMFLPWFLIGAFSAAYTVLAIWNYARFETGLDLGIYSQALHHLSHFRLPFSSLKDQVLWGDHAHFFLALLAPFYRLLPDPRLLLVVQALAVTSAGWPLYRLAHALTRSRFFATALLFTFLSFIGLQHALNLDFHSTVLTGVALAWAIYALHFRNTALYWTAFLLGLTTREDAGPIFFMVGVTLLLGRRLRLGLATMGIALTYFLLIGYVVMPIWTRGHFPLVYLDVEDKNPLHIVRGVVRYPFTTIQNMVDTPLKVRTIRLLFTSFGGLPLLSPFTYVTSFPIFYSRFLSPNDYRWTIENHSNANIAPLLAAGAILGAAHVLRLTRRLGGERARTIAALALGLLLLGSSYRFAWHDEDAPLRKLVRREFLALPQSQRIAFRRAAALIPPTAPLSASHAYVPHVSNRASIVLFPTISPDTEWILLSRRNTWPLKKDEMNAARRAIERDPTWGLVFRGESVELFRRLTDAPATPQ